MAVDKITNHKQLAKNRIIEQYKQKPNINSIIDIHAERYQQLEDMLFVFLSIIDLENAVQDQLNIVGSMVGVPRGAFNDDDYRALIKIQIAVTLTRGSIPDQLNVARALTDPTKVIYIPDYPAKFFLILVNPTPIVAITEVRRILESEVAPSGVGLTLVTAPTGYFGFANDPNAFGFGVGKFASIIPEV